MRDAGVPIDDVVEASTYGPDELRVSDLGPGPEHPRGHAGDQAATDTPTAVRNDRFFPHIAQGTWDLLKMQAVGPVYASIRRASPP